MKAGSSSSGSGVDGIAFLVDEAGESYALRGLFSRIEICQNRSRCLAGFSYEMNMGLTRRSVGDLASVLMAAGGDPDEDMLNVWWMYNGYLDGLSIDRKFLGSIDR